MKLWIMSDLHVDVCDYAPPPVDADLVVLAGDIAEGMAGLDWAARHLAGRDVLYVAGNHEFYGHELFMLSARFRARGGGPLHVLDGSGRVIGGVRFLGCTLWTDFLLYGEAVKPQAMTQAQQYMHDFHRIHYAADAYGTGLLTPADTLQLHEVQRRWLAGQLAEPFTGPTVVITHHAPHRGSLHPRFATDPVSAGFLSDLEPLMGQAALWIHGHTHHSFDYEVNGTRVVCNPRGYATATSIENGEFDPALVIEV